MGDVLPPKRQTVVERLKRRFELYRRHQSACLPRYEQAANGLFEAQRQETLLLKQRFLETKAKKAKNNKNDHHRNYKDSTSDASKTQLHTKSLKRPAEESVANPVSECANSEDAEKPAKVSRTETVPDKPAASELKPVPQPQPTLPSFSVQIVQQFSKPSHGQQSQTIQTNVTVQALTKPLNSPISQAPQQVATNQQGQQEAAAKQDKNQVSATVGNILSTETNVECKQEKDCGQSDLCQFKNNQSSNSGGGGDRLSDTFPSLGFTDDSGDDVIHPDILKDLIDDVFTNSADIMKDFNFEDSVGSMKDQEDATKDIIDLVKASSPTQLRSFQTENLPFGNTQANQHQQNGGISCFHNAGLFRNISTNNETAMSVMSTTTSTPTTTASTFYNTPSQRLPSYSNASLSLPSGLGLDFKLTEPSPAALTLKQMAEQHQNMQQKQQQQLVSSPLTNRPSPFGQDSYAAHMNPLRQGSYLNGSNPTLTSNSPKTPNSAGPNIFNTFDRQVNNYPGTEPLSSFPGCEPISPNNIFDPEIRSRASVVMPDADRAKQQRLQMDPSCHQMEQQQQKPPAYGATRPLTHYSENPAIRHQNPLSSQQHQRPIGRQFPNNLQMTQTQHVHSGPAQHNTQHLQQGGAHDLKQQHNLMQTHTNMFGNYTSQQPANNPAFHVSMSQSLTYGTQFSSSQAMTRPPPEYKAHHPNLSTDNLHITEHLNSPHMMFNHPSKNKFSKQQRAPNVTITPDGSAVSSSCGDWRQNLLNQQHHTQFRLSSFPHQENYADLIRNEHLANVPNTSVYNQYRMPSNPIPTNRMTRPNMVPTNHMLVLQRQRVPSPQRLRNPSVNEIEQQHSSIAMSNNALSPASVMGVYSSHQDMSRQDGSQINLDFLDNIESSASDLLNFDQVIQSGGSHFPLLDDMEILGK